MTRIFPQVFSAITIIFLIVGIVLMIKSFRRNTKAGKYMGLAFLFSMISGAAYTGVVLCANDLPVSICYTIYFAFVDYTVICLMRLIFELIELKNKIIVRSISYTFLGLSLLDTVMLVWNIFNNFAVTYIKAYDYYPYYIFKGTPAYTFHLMISYVMIAIIIGFVIAKMVSVPKSYRSYYINMLIFVFTAVAVNAIFLFFPKELYVTRFDFAVWVYDIIGVLFYWDAFYYRQKMMPNIYRNDILKNIDIGVLLFDYNDKVILSNDRLKTLLPKANIEFGTSLEELCTNLELKIDLSKDTSSFRIYPSSGNSESVITCNYQTIIEGKKKSGRLFTFAYSIPEYDGITGFKSWELFKLSEKTGRENYGYPIAAIIFAPNNITAINKEKSREYGDYIITLLSSIIREKMPENSEFIRYRDSKLLVILRHAESYGKISEYISDIEYEFEMRQDHVIQASFQHGTCLIHTRNGQTILSAVHEAYDTLVYRKLMDPRSYRSELINMLRQTLRECDNETEEHVVRTQIAGFKLGIMLKLSQYELSKLALLCVLHDIGKVGIPIEILNKPGKLNDEEWEIIKDHTYKGYHIAMASPDLESIADCILSHHERWDGKGYPIGLSGEDIPYLSRIISVVDSYDAMVNDRVYRKAFSKEKAMSILREESGKQFDPTIVEAFLTILEEEPSKSKHAKPKEKSIELDDVKESPKDNDSFKKEESQKTQPVIVHPSSDNIQSVTFCKYILDEDEMIISIDDNFELMTGYSKEDIDCGLGQLDLIPPEDTEAYIHSVEDGKKSGNVVVLEHNILTKSKKIIKVLCIGERKFNPVAKKYTSEITVSIKE